MIRHFYLSIIIIALILSILPIAPVSSANILRQAFSPELAGFKTVVFYYGWLNTSNILDLRIDIAVIAGSTRVLAGGDDYDIVQWLRGNGTEVYAYLHDGDTPVGLGSSFNTMVYSNDTGSLDQRLSYWVSYIESLIDNYVGIADGVFLDECDPGYFGVTNSSDPYVQAFSQGIEEIVDYAHSKGLKAFVNGVRAYAGIGDYYLWEDFVAIYDSGVYKLDTSFYSTSNDNPYEWVNGLAKYEYLRDNNLLSKTIALSFANQTTLDNALYAYYMARILGLGGWGFSPIDIYASGGTIYTVKAFDPGNPIDDPVIDPVNGVSHRYFIPGMVSVDLYTPDLRVPFTYRDICVDGSPSEYTLDTSGIDGTYSTINSYGYLATPNGIYFYVNATWSTASSGGLVHVYIDYDNDPSTGYSYGGIGADYLIEIQASGYSYVAEYTGSGSDWSWNELGQIDKYIGVYGNNYVIEFKAPEIIYEINSSVFILTTMHDWDDDVVTPITTIADFYVNPPTIYDHVEGYSSYFGIVEDVMISDDKMIIEAYAPDGAYVNYTFIVPSTNILGVRKNGTALPRMSSPSFTGEGYYVKTIEDYSYVVVIVKHGSPVTIEIEYGVPQPVYEPYYIVIVLSALLILLLLRKNR